MLTMVWLTIMNKHPRLLWLVPVLSCLTRTAASPARPSTLSRRTRRASSAELSVASILSAAARDLGWRMILRWGHKLINKVKSALKNLCNLKWYTHFFIIRTSHFIGGFKKVCRWRMLKVSLLPACICAHNFTIKGLPHKTRLLGLGPKGQNPTQNLTLWQQNKIIYSGSHSPVLHTKCLCPSQ